MSWYLYNGDILTNGGKIAIGAECCCPVCCNCAALDGYNGNLCFTVSGLLSIDNTPGTAVLYGGTSPGNCGLWQSSGFILWDDPNCLDTDFTATELQVICKEDGTVKINFSGPSEDPCNPATEFNEEVDPDTIECGDSYDDDVEITKTYTLPGGACGCSGTITFTITKC
jgi:hypothetical protein